MQRDSLFTATLTLGLLNSSFSVGAPCACEKAAAKVKGPGDAHQMQRSSCLYSAYEGGFQLKTLSGDHAQVKHAGAAASDESIKAKPVLKTSTRLKGSCVRALWTQYTK